MKPVAQTIDKQQQPVLSEEQRKSLRPLTKQLHSKLYSLVLHLYQNDELNKNIQKFKDSNLLVLKQCPETEGFIKQEFQMTFNQFLKYMKVIGCRIRAQQKSYTNQQRYNIHLIYFKSPQFPISEPMLTLPKFQKQAEAKVANNHNYGEISLQISLKKSEIHQRLILEQQKQSKQKAIERLSKNMKQANIISQYTIFKILEYAIKNSCQDQDKSQRILDNIIQVKDRMEQCEGIIKQCLLAIGEGQNIKIQTENHE